MAVTNAMSGNCLVGDLPNIYLVNKRISSLSLKLCVMSLVKSSLIFFPSWKDVNTLYLCCLFICLFHITPEGKTITNLIPVPPGPSNNWS